MKFDFEAEKSKMEADKKKQEEHASKKAAQQTDAKQQLENELRELCSAASTYARKHAISLETKQDASTATLSQGQKTFVIKGLAQGRYEITVGARRPSVIAGEGKLMREIIQWLSPT